MRIEHEDNFDPYSKLSKEDYIKTLSSYHKQINKNHFTPTPTPHQSHPKALEQKVSIHLSSGSSMSDVIKTLLNNVEISFIISNDIAGILKSDMHLVEQPIYKIIDYLNDVYSIRTNYKEDLVEFSLDLPYVKTYKINFINMKRQKIEYTESNFKFPKTIFKPQQIRKKKSSPKDEWEIYDLISPTIDKSLKSKSHIVSSAIYDFWGELEKSIKFTLRMNKECSYSINKSSGTILIDAPYSLQKIIAHIISDIKRTSQLQVMIEAKVLFVELNDKYKRGINWNLFQNTPLSILSKLQTNLSGNKIGIKIDGKEEIINDKGESTSSSEAGFETFFNLLDCFGAIRTISNPRLQVLNNQAGMFRVISNEIFTNFNFQRDLKTISSAKAIIINTEKQNIPIGFILTVQPSINTENGNILMHIKPTFSKKINDVIDQGATYTLNSIKNPDQKLNAPPTIPLVRINEIETIANIKSGEILALGGFMRIESQHTEHKIPGLGNIKSLRTLFKGKEDTKCASEIVILIKATIIDPNNGVDFSDKELLKTFTKDDRRAF